MVLEIIIKCTRKFVLQSFSSKAALHGHIRIHCIAKSHSNHHNNNNSSNHNNNNISSSNPQNNPYYSTLSNTATLSASQSTSFVHTSAMGSPPSNNLTNATATATFISAAVTAATGTASVTAAAVTAASSNAHQQHPHQVALSSSSSSSSSSSLLSPQSGKRAHHRSQHMISALFHFVHFRTPYTKNFLIIPIVLLRKLRSTCQIPDTIYTCPILA